MCPSAPSFSPTRAISASRPLFVCTGGLWTDLAEWAAELHGGVQKKMVGLGEELRAPWLFAGRQGISRRRKLVPGQRANHAPSVVLSEGEQKVLAMADFLAEARMTPASPVAFDDPVCNLDHGRIREVAARIRNPSKNRQVVVFTHDIWFAESLLDDAENPDGFTLLRVTANDGRGVVTHSTGPRWDPLREFGAAVDRTIPEARGPLGNERIKLVRVVYGCLRSWCGVFVENDPRSLATYPWPMAPIMNAFKPTGSTSLGPQAMSRPPHSRLVRISPVRYA